MTHKVFISYAKDDRATADTVCQKLEAAGVESWIAPRNIPPGAAWPEALVDAVTSSRLVVLMLSKHANRSHHVAREVSIAFDHGVTVVPFHIDNTPPSKTLQYFLQNVQWFNGFDSPLQIGLELLICRVKDLVSTSEPGAADAGPMTVFRDSERNLIISLRRAVFAKSAKMTAQFDFGLTKGLLGPSSNPSDQLGFHNQENTLFGINHQPATKCSYVHLFLLTDGELLFFADVNARAAQLLDEPFSSAAIHFLRIENIAGTAIKLQTVDFRERVPYPQKEFFVNVDGYGAIALIQ
jgi:TIR domain